MTSPRLSLIAAMSENRIIGKGNGLPWHISADLKNFRRLTMGKPVIMGRRTFESIGKPLPGRPNVVITRDPGFRPAGVVVCGSPDSALVQAQTLAEESGADEIMVIGGAEIYAVFLPRAERLYLTRIHARIEGDAHFPAFDPTDWTEVSRDLHDPETADGPSFSFGVFDRTLAASRGGGGPWRKCVSEAFEAAQEELIGGHSGRSNAGND